MRKWVFVILSLLGTGLASAQDHYAFGFSPDTGDVWVDARLGDFNVYANGNLDGFVHEVEVSYGAPRVLVHEYVVERRWPPGDVYYACALAYQLHRPCREVLDIWARDHAQGWGVIARRLGIKPGSPAFHALKGNVGKSNAKWRGKSGKNKARGKPARGDEREHGRDKSRGH